MVVPCPLMWREKARQLSKGRRSNLCDGIPRSSNNPTDRTTPSGNQPPDATPPPTAATAHKNTPSQIRPIRRRICLRCDN
ncbi:hypothetical protein GWI33_013644 [Rhynchophorus ferrugineus]|uniref:Uncharacterized protein n=1 Tax=Rhynchophorus ferrugineus TaxID=354439 RepID=A0A834I6P5_RHYFE|nr:hypothetical protein GWI33_013644 [Rhynchophorus ferrugineus]